MNPLLTTQRFCAVLGFRVSDRLPLQVFETVSPTALNSDDMIHAVAGTVLTHLAGSGTRRYLAKFSHHRRAALDSPLRISWTRNASLPTPKWASQQDQN